MPEYDLGLFIHILFRVGLDRQAGVIAPQVIPDGDAHGVAGRLLVAPVVDFLFLRFQAGQQLDRNGLDLADLPGTQIRFAQQIEDGQ